MSGFAADGHERQCAHEHSETMRCLSFAQHGAEYCWQHDPAKTDERQRDRPGQTFKRMVADLRAERTRQNAKWGEQNHPDGTGPGVRFWTADMATMRHVCRQECDDAAKADGMTWRHILLQEIFEALAESDPAKLRAELVQAGVVIVQWIEAIDRRGDS